MAGSRIVAWGVMAGMIAACSGAPAPAGPAPVSSRPAPSAFAAEAAAAAARAQAREAAEEAAVQAALDTKPSVRIDAAAPLARAVQAALDVGDVAGAKAALARWEEAGASPRELAQARTVLANMEAAQRPVAPLRGARWLQGTAGARHTQLYIAWELWCPHCRRHMPELQQTAETWGSRGLEVVGLTTLSRGTAEAAARKFLADDHITFANAVVPASTVAALGNAGVPHAYLVVDGQMRWHGHPAEISDALLKRWTR
ncbi:MAG: TlpA family protein disulfide reductase [Alphaproteobacteria bacterium]|nr:TlpA family protein disulfide reductase [Alphaproteobacteria bacterium]